MRLSVAPTVIFMYHISIFFKVYKTYFNELKKKKEREYLEMLIYFNTSLYTLQAEVRNTHRKKKTLYCKLINYFKLNASVRAAPLQ